MVILSLSFLQPFMSPRYPGGPRPALRMPNQPPGGIPGSQPLLPNSLDPTRPQGRVQPARLFQRSCTHAVSCWSLSEQCEQCCRANKLLSMSHHRTSKHGRSNENESPPRHGRDGSTGKHQSYDSLLVHMITQRAVGIKRVVTVARVLYCFPPTALPLCSCRTHTFGHRQFMNKPNVWSPFIQSHHKSSYNVKPATHKLHDPSPLLRRSSGCARLVTFCL